MSRRVPTNYDITPTTTKWLFSASGPGWGGGLSCTCTLYSNLLLISNIHMYVPSILFELTEINTPTFLFSVSEQSFCVCACRNTYIEVVTFEESSRIDLSVR